MQYKLEKPIKGTIGTSRYQCSIEWRNGRFMADEPEKNGGQGQDPDPFTLLLSALASCTLITLRMYIERKGWDVPTITVNANMFQTRQGENVQYFLDRDIIFPNSKLNTEQKDKLAEIASKCPISLILEGSTKVRTFIYHEEDVDKKIDYKNDHVTVVWKPELCKHSGRCVTQLPQVFNLKAHPWVNVNGSDAETIIDQVHKCPTGALSIRRDEQ